jgi:malic enzyme
MPPKRSAATVRGVTSLAHERVTSHPSASFSATLRVHLDNRPGSFAQLGAAIGAAGGLLGAIDLVRVERGKKIRDVTVLADDDSHIARIVDAVREIDGVEVEHVSDRTFLLHLGGKLEVAPKTPLKTRDDLSMAYTPGVARVCRAIAEDPDKVWNLTIKQNAVAEETNPRRLHGSADEALARADVYIGLSVPNAVSAAAVRTMARDAIVFAMANPVPEVVPEQIEDVAAVIGTGRSDYPNQINNVLAFPGVFRGALDVRASAVTREMELAAAHALAAVVEREHLASDYVIPSVFDRRVTPAVADAVARVAEKTGVARRRRAPASVS